MAQVIWTEPALDDLEAIADYIALDKPGAAKRLVQQVFARVEQLALFPKSGGKPRELSGTPYRQVDGQVGNDYCCTEGCTPAGGIV